MEHILIVDDEAGIRSTLGEILADEGYATTLASSLEETRKQLQRGFYDLAILDIWLPDGDGLDLLTEIRRDHAETPVLMISGHASIDTAVKALHQGAYDFLEKPLSLSRVLVTVQNALDHSRLARELRQLEERFDKSEVLVGDSEVMQRLRHDLKTAAQSDSRILITGENGTGKELVARQVHRLLAPARQAVHRGQLRRHPRGADRERAVRPSQGRLHRRGLRSARALRAGRRRHALPRRDRRHVDEDAGQGAARARGAALPARGRRRPGRSRRARAGRHQPRPRAGDRDASASATTSSSGSR